MKTKDKEKEILFLFVQGISKKELIDAISMGAKLTKADAGKIITVLPKVVINQVIYIDAKIAHGKLTKADKVALIDAIAASAKLTKADAGRALDATIESIHKSLAKKLKVVFGGRGLRKLKTVFGGKGQ